MIVERLSAPSLLFHDAGAGLGIGQSPADNPILEQLVEKVAESAGKVVAASAGGETADAVEDFPDGDRRETESFNGNRIKTGGNTRLRLRSHHLGDDVGINQP